MPAFRLLPHPSPAQGHSGETPYRHAARTGDQQQGASADQRDDGPGYHEGRSESPGAQRVLYTEDPARQPVGYHALYQ